MTDSMMYHEGNRRLQDAFDSRRISDRLEEKLTRFAFTDGDLAFFLVEIGEIFHVDIEYPGTDFANGLNDIGAGANGMADINAAPDARIQAFYGFQDIQRRMPQLVFGAVIVDGEANVEFRPGGFAASFPAQSASDTRARALFVTSMI